MTTEERPDAGDSEGTDDEVTHARRRELLRAGTALGTSAALVLGFGAEYVSSGETETITYALARPEPDADALEPRTKEVPIEWYESLQLAFEVQERVLAAGLAPLVGSFVVPGTFADSAATISVDSTDESVLETLEDLTGDVRLDLNVVDPIPPKPGGETDLSDAYQVSELDDGDVPGGVVCLSEDSFGTLTPALYDGDGSRYFATSNHVFGASGTKETEHRGDPLSVRHDGEERRVGTVDRGYPTADVVRVSPVEEYRPASAIERASPSRVLGQFTKIGLADLMARGKPLTKVGALSDTTSGEIQGIDGLTCYTGEVCKPGQLKWGDEHGIVDGDSGSAAFHADPENPDDGLLVASINNARSWWSEADFVWGTAAHHLLDAYDLHF
ncbi:hypothetical protein [Halorarum salinum]|uniref:Uncharacterized protein n=1 Tax=Halorarum salinum TaxID=2743089 RepID=A0A7D5QJE8_9EURY|nr:hypothetical protein [Halobaculum salinum]QLG63704.1 hypothetical protein HUG12_19020 [Halobaculum salinum]